MRNGKGTILSPSLRSARMSVRPIRTLPPSTSQTTCLQPRTRTPSMSIQMEAPFGRSTLWSYWSSLMRLAVVCFQLLPTLRTSDMSSNSAVEVLTAEAMMSALCASAPTSSLIRKPVIRHIYMISSLAITLALLPLWTIRYAHPSWRPRRSWNLGTTLRVRAKRDICALVGTLEVDTLGRDLSIDMVPKDLKHTHPVTIPPVSEDSLRGHPAEMLARLRESALKGLWAPHFVHRPEKTDPSAWKADWLARDSMDYGPAPVKAFWYAGEKTMPDSPLPPLQPGEPVGLYFHGGGYLAGTAAETDLIAAIPKQIVSGSHIRHILSVDYRLAPQGPWPLPLIDAISSYAHLVSLGVKPSEIVIFGDSAGGHLAMALTRWLRDEGQNVGFGMPRGLVLMSPWSDLGFTDAWGEGRTYNVQSDLIDDTFGPFACGLLLRALPVSLLYETPYLSPASLLIPPSASGVDSMADFPPTCIIYGGAERLSRSINELWSRLQLARKSDTIGRERDMLWEGEDCVHDFMIFPWQKAGAVVAHSKLDQWLAKLLSCASEHRVYEVDPENSPVLVPSWASLAESMDNNVSLGGSALTDTRTTLSIAMPSQTGSLKTLRLRLPRKKTETKTRKVGRAKPSRAWLDFSNPFKVFESDEETLVDDDESVKSSDSSVTLAEDVRLGTETRVRA